MEQPIDVLDLENVLALAAVTSDPDILVAKKNTPLSVVHGSAGWHGLARFSWSWIQVPGLIQVCSLPMGPRLRNNS